MRNNRHAVITLLTVKQKKGPTLFVKPIGIRFNEGDSHADH